MKKKLESELVSIAHRILKLKGKEDVAKMHNEVALLYEKLTVLKFAFENFEDNLPVIGSDPSLISKLDDVFNSKVNEAIEVEKNIYTNLDANKNVEAPISRKVKRVVAFAQKKTKAIKVTAVKPKITETDSVEAKTTKINPNNEHVIEAHFEKAPTTQTANRSNLEDITAGFSDIPVFEPVEQSQNKLVSAKKSLNDSIKIGGLHIGLNDKIAFIKHLFDGKSEDYDRVLSQLNTFGAYSTTKNFIDTIVKPDYNNWENKDEFEERFMKIIEAKFN